MGRGHRHADWLLPSGAGIAAEHHPGAEVTIYHFVRPGGKRLLPGRVVLLVQPASTPSVHCPFAGVGG